MTIAIRSGSDNGPVTIAEVNLKFIWDVVSRIKIGDKGKAYVVDGNGFLIADPDIGLVLRKTSMSRAAARQGGDRHGKRTRSEPAMVSTDLAGTSVLTSVAPIDRSTGTSSSSSRSPRSTQSSTRRSCARCFCCSPAW